jgi:D-inositol-3-phosphate glycosyltransferase
LRTAVARTFCAPADSANRTCGKAFTPNGPQAARSGEHRVVGVGKILLDNGFDALVRALRLIPAAEFVIIGEAERGDQQSDREARRLRGLAERLGVADRLRVHAHATDAEIPELLRSADVVACTPTYEPSGVVALEATACGVPGGGLRGRDLAASVNHLLRDSFLRRSLGTGGRNRPVARYSWDRIAVDTARLYEKSMSALAGERTAAS